MRKRQKYKSKYKYNGKAFSKTPPLMISIILTMNNKIILLFSFQNENHQVHLFENCLK